VLRESLIFAIGNIMRWLTLLLSCLVVSIGSVQVVAEVQNGNTGLHSSNQQIVGNAQNTRFRRALQEAITTATSAAAAVNVAAAPVEKSKDDDYSQGNGEIRTATGGFVYTLMVTLTVVAFVSNGAFLVYVFWLSK
jgi:hypothetical protein